MEAGKVSINGWMNKEDVIYIMEYYSAMKRKIEILPFATTWMELDSIMLSKISQRKSNIIWSHSYVEFKRQKKKEQKKKKRDRDKPRKRLLNIENKLMVTRGEGSGAMKEIGDEELNIMKNKLNDLKKSV